MVERLCTFGLYGTIQMLLLLLLIMLSIDMQFMLDEEKRIFDMVPKRPDTMADIVIVKCMQNRWLNALFPFLVLFGAHVLSFYE